MNIPFEKHHLTHQFSWESKFSRETKYTQITTINKYLVIQIRYNIHIQYKTINRIPLYNAMGIILR